MDIIKEVPKDDIIKLVKDANCKFSWETRLNALNKLKDYDCPQSRNVIIRLALHDKVYKVKEEAFHAAQALEIATGGKPIRLGKKDIGYSNKDFIKVFQRIKRKKKMTNLDLDVFKETFIVSNAEMYDVMKYEKGKGFDSWIQDTFKGLPKK